MRIIAGEWRGRTVRAPEGENTRPTGDRTRETLFSMLHSRLGSFEDLKVADLFAGSGALGLEALSRGAASCLFVEQDAGAIKAIRGNLAALGAAARADVRAASVMTLGAVKEPVDLLLLDPPYGSGAGAVALDRLARLGWIDGALGFRTLANWEPRIVAIDADAALAATIKMAEARNWTR